MTRNGKIARLPKHIRLDLNHRLDDGEQARQLVDWLNGLPDVHQVLKSQFGSRPISEQNLSEWRQGGYLDWLQHQESCDLVQRLTEQSEDLEPGAQERPLSDRFATLLAVELARASEALLKEVSDPRERWQRLREFLQALSQLRQNDGHAARLQIEQERWEREKDRLDAQERDRETKEEKRRATAPIWAALEVQPLAQAFGGGEKAREIAALVTEINHDLEPGTLTGRGRSCSHRLLPSNPIKPNQTQSNRIKPPPRLPALRQAVAMG